MVAVFVALDLLLFFLYHGWNSNHYAALEILLLGLAFFGCIQSTLGHRKPLAFLASTLGLLASLCAYEISFRSEEALGVPLQAAGALDHLIHDPSTREIFFLQLESHAWQIASVAVCAIPLLVVTYRLIVRVPSLCPIYIRSVSGCAILASFAIGIWSPTTFRGDTRLLFYFGWPPVINLGGSDVYREESAARDELARQTYNGSPKDPASIVLIFADSLRADHLSLYGYNRETTPYLSSSHAEGKLKRVEWAFSSCSESFCGVASTLSSKPFYRISERSLKVNELLQRAGYETWAFAGGDHDKFAQMALFYGTSFDQFIDYRGYPQYSQNDDAFIIEGLQTLPAAADRPRFLFFFLMSSHVLGARPEGSSQFEPSDVKRFLVKWHTRDALGFFSKLKLQPEEAHTLLNNNYDNGLLAADLRIKQIFEQLEHKGYLSNSLVMILGDHGDALGEHNHLGHTYRLYNEDIRIPLLIYDTSGRSLENLTYASQEDIAPTLLDRIGMPQPRVFAGHSLYSSKRQTSIHQTRRGTNPCFASTLNELGHLYKYITCRNGDENHVEVYDLTSDPREESNIVDTVSDEVLAKLRDQLSMFKNTIENTCSRYDCVED